jgi:hypothetical protein
VCTFTEESNLFLNQVPINRGIRDKNVLKFSAPASVVHFLRGLQKKSSGASAPVGDFEIGGRKFDLDESWPTARSSQHST